MFLTWQYNGYDVNANSVVSAVEDHTLIAQWKLNQHRITFDANGGVGGWSEARDYDSALAAPVVSRVGYTFTGWSPTVPVAVPANDATFTAQWQVNTHTVTFDANGGTAVIPGSQSYVAGQTFGEFPVPSRRGYAFCGWWTEAVGGDRMTEASRVPAADVELFAHWEPIRYFVAYDANGGTGVMENQTIQIGETQNLHTNAFAFSGREFLGWATESGGIVAYRDGQAVSGLASANGATVHLYAVWRRKPSYFGFGVCQGRRKVSGCRFGDD